MDMSCCISGDQPTDHADPNAVTVLRELLAEERAKSDLLLEAETVWQTRAVHLEQQLKQLTAGDNDRDADAGSAHTAPRGTADAPEPTDEPRSRLRRWWTRLWGDQQQRT